MKQKLRNEVVDSQGVDQEKQEEQEVELMHRDIELKMHQNEKNAPLSPQPNNNNINDEERTIEDDETEGISGNDDVPTCEVVVDDVEEVALSSAVRVDEVEGEDNLENFDLEHSRSLVHDRALAFSFFLSASEMAAEMSELSNAIEANEQKKPSNIAVSKLFTRTRQKHKIRIREPPGIY